MDVGWQEILAIGRCGSQDQIDYSTRHKTLRSLLDNGEAGQFDFVFIDADKNNYDTYYEPALELLRPQGIVAIDNVFWGGAVIDSSRQDEDTAAIRRLNAKVQLDERVDINMLPIGDGLTLSVKR